MTQAPLSMLSHQDVYSQRNIGSFLLQDNNDWLQSNINSNSNLKNHLNASSPKFNNISLLQKSKFSNQKVSGSSQNIQDDIQDVQMVLRKKSINTQKEEFKIVSIIYRNLRKVIIDADQININVYLSDQLKQIVINQKFFILNRNQCVNQDQENTKIQVIKKIKEEGNSNQSNTEKQSLISQELEQVQSNVIKQESKPDCNQSPELEINIKQSSKQSTDSQGIDSSQEQKPNKNLNQFGYI